MFKNILVATDGSDHADKAVAVAADLATRYGVGLTLLHVLLRRNAEAADLRSLIDVENLADDTREEFERFEEMQRAKDAATAGVVSVSFPFPAKILAAVGNAIIDKAEGIAKEHGVAAIDRVVLEGAPADAILDVAKSKDTDLIVLGTRGQSDLQGLLVGSVSHKVSHLAQCTCISVR